MINHRFEIGFVAVVVCLVAIILIAGTGAVILLQEGSSRDEESGRRHSRYSQQPSLPSVREYVAPSGEAPKPSWPSLLGSKLNFSGSKSGSCRSPSRVKLGTGDDDQLAWVQTASTETWEVPSLPLPLQAPPRLAELSFKRSHKELPSVRSSLRTSRLTNCPSPTKSSTRNSHPTGDSVSSVRFNLSGLTYRDSFAPSPQPTLQGLNLHYSSPASTSPLAFQRSVSSEPGSPITIPQEQQAEVVSCISSHSGTTTRTLQHGTRFVEHCNS